MAPSAPVFNPQMNQGSFNSFGGAYPQQSYQQQQQPMPPQQHYGNQGGYQQQQ